MATPASASTTSVRGRRDQLDAGIVGQVQAGAGEPVGHPVLAAVGVAESLVLIARHHVAPAAWESAQYPCAVARLVAASASAAATAESRTARSSASGAASSVQAVGVEERGVGVAGQERRVAQHVDQQVAVGAARRAAGCGPVRRRAPARRGSGSGRRRSPWPASGRSGSTPPSRPRCRSPAGCRCWDSGPNCVVSAGHVEVVDLTGLRLPAPRGILGVEPRLDGVPGRDRWLRPAAPRRRRPPVAARPDPGRW